MLGECSPQLFGKTMKKLKESVEFFDQYISAALRNDLSQYEALEVVKHYSIVKAELSKLLIREE